MDLEGFAKSKLREGRREEDIISGMSTRIVEIKKIKKGEAEGISRAVLEEAKRTVDLKDDLGILVNVNSGLTMGEFGVGSRGLGDFYAHERIAKIIGRTRAVVDSSSLSDSGVVSINFSGGENEKRGEKFIVVTVDGMHSRLSDFPFLAGFHVARAALRDIWVMGAIPIALFSDIHVADDGDVGKIFDHIAGISTISDATGVPLVTGSTLRIGGDVVIGERMTGCVGAVGVADEIITREGAREGDVILMTEGAGGGTISTAALYYGEYDVVYETLNIKFLETCKALNDKNAMRRIHAMTDITNGGIRGDANEISKVSGVKLLFFEDKIRRLVNERVLWMLEKHGIDYLGVSLDSLLVICPEDATEEVKEVVGNKGVRIEEIGRVEEGGEEGAEIIINGERKKFIQNFRESAYTPIKKVVGEKAEKDFEEMKRKVDKAVEEAIDKKKRVEGVLNLNMKV